MVGRHGDNYKPGETIADDLRTSRRLSGPRAIARSSRPGLTRSADGRGQDRPEERSEEDHLPLAAKND